MIPSRPLLIVISAILLETSCKPRLELSRNCAPSESNLERSATISTNGGSVATMTILEELESRLSRLERRLRAVEQPGKPSFLPRARGFLLCFLQSNSPSVRRDVWFDRKLSKMRIVRSLADELRRGGLGDLRGGAVQVSTGDEIGVLLETESVGPPRGAAGSPRCVETVSPLSLSLFLPLLSLLFRLSHKRRSRWKKTGISFKRGKIVKNRYFYRDLAGNRLTALHRDTFLDMTRLNHL